jgi:hypothetical protein
MEKNRTRKYLRVFRVTISLFRYPLGIITLQESPKTVCCCLGAEEFLGNSDMEILRTTQFPHRLKVLSKFKFPRLLAVGNIPWHYHLREGSSHGVMVRTASLGMVTHRIIKYRKKLTSSRKIKLKSL